MFFGASRVPSHLTPQSASKRKGSNSKISSLEASILNTTSRGVPMGVPGSLSVLYTSHLKPFTTRVESLTAGLGRWSQRYPIHKERCWPAGRYRSPTSNLKPRSGAVPGGGSSNSDSPFLLKEGSVDCGSINTWSLKMQISRRLCLCISFDIGLVNRRRRRLRVF